MEFAIKACSRLHKQLYKYLLLYKDCSDCEISADVTFLTYVTLISAAFLISCHAKPCKYNLALSQDEKPCQTENLWKNKSSAVRITNQTKISKGLIIPYFYFWQRHVETKSLVKWFSDQIAKAETQLWSIV